MLSIRITSIPEKNNKGLKIMFIGYVPNNNDDRN